MATRIATRRRNADRRAAAFSSRSYGRRTFSRRRISPTSTARSPRPRPSSPLNEVVPAADEIEAKNFDVTRGLLRKAGELGLMAVDIPEAYGGLEMDKVTSALVAESMSQLASFSVAFSRARRHRHAAHRLVRHGGAEAASTCPSWPRASGSRAYALSESSSGSDAMNCRTRAVLSRRRPPLRAQRREDVDHQQRVRRPVHGLRQDRRGEVLRVPDRAGHAGLSRRRRGAQAGHSRIIHLPADSERLQGAGGEPARRARQGPPHRVQHPEHRPVQAGRGVRGRRAQLRSRTPSSTPRSARRSANPSPSSA